MSFAYFSKNGHILPIDAAQVPLSNLEYSYGYGVYETMKVRNGILYFADQHVARLHESARIIGLAHPFTNATIQRSIVDLLQRLDLTGENTSCNIKMLLIGGKQPHLYIFALAPLFPDRKLYKKGAKAITVHYQRMYPNAKTLNMLPSYLAYKKAREQGCYDALLISRKGAILEGTRTNFFALKGNSLVTAPTEDILEGVTRQTVMAVAKRLGFTIKETAIPLAKIAEYDGCFVTSTSTKIMPLAQIDDITFAIPEKVKALMKAYDTFLDECLGVFPK